MALELSLTDNLGNVYPNAYRKFVGLLIEDFQRKITVVFRTYPTQQHRRDNPDRYIEDLSPAYLIVEDRQPAVLSYNGTGTLDQVVLASLGVAVDEEGVVTHDPVISLLLSMPDIVALATMGITVVTPAIPSYEDFAGPDEAAGETAIRTQIYRFAKGMANVATIDVLE